MGITALHILIWLLTACTLKTQELVKLSVSETITAECGKQVTLNCDVSSSTHQLSIKHMKWFQDKKSLCSVNGDGEILTYPTHTRSDFHCEYEHGRLSLVFNKVEPLESGNSTRYMCKLQSNAGVTQGYTTVELQECGTVRSVWTTGGPSCIFNHVYPDGDVHWSHGSRRLSEGSVRHNTTKQVVGGGWLTIRSYLEQESSDGPYSCALKSSQSGRYIVGTSVQKPSSSFLIENGVGSQRPMRTFLCMSVLLAVTLK